MNCRKLKGGWILALMVWWTLHAGAIYAQTEMRFKNLSHKEGFGSNWYFHIVEDSLGYIWFGGHTGLTRYDGRKGLTFVKDIKDSTSLGHNEIFRVMASEDGHIWCSTTGGGVSVLNPRDGEFTNHSTHNGEWPTDRVGEIIPFSDSIFYFLGGEEKSIFKAAKGAQGWIFSEVPLYAESDRISFQETKARYIYRDIKYPDLLWIIGHFRIYQYDTKIDELKLFHEFDFLLDQAIFYDLIPAAEWIDEDRLLLYIINKGYYEFSVRDESLKFLYFDEENLPHHCRYIKKLQSGEYLLGYSDGRLFKYYYPQNFTTQVPIDYPRVKMPWIEYIFEAKNGDVYIAMNGNGIMKWEKSYHAIQWVVRDALKPDYTNLFNQSFISEDGARMLWSKFGTDTLFIHDIATGEVQLVRNSNIPGISVGYMTAGPDNTVLTHTGKAIYKIDLEHEICSKEHLEGLDEFLSNGHHIKRVELDEEGQMWVYGLDFVSMYIDNSRVRHYSLIQQEDIKVTNYKYVVRSSGHIVFFGWDNEIYALDMQTKELMHVKTKLSFTYPSCGQPIEHKGDILIPNHSLGLFITKMEGDSLLKKQLLTSNDFLISDNVYALSKVGEHIWVSTGMGLQRWDPSNHMTFDVDYRYTVPEYYIDAPIQGHTSGYFSLPLATYIYHGNINDIIPDTIDAYAEVYAISVKNEDRLTGSRNKATIKLYPGEKTLQFKWSVLSSAPNNAYQVAYRLDGFSDEWTIINEWEDLQANYTNLAAGDYIFSVKVIPNTGQVPFEVLKIDVRVDQEFWKSSYFKVLMVLILMLVTLILYKWRTNTIRKQEALKIAFEKRLAKMQWQNLETQMNPHFMYNSLNSIKRMILQGKGKEASEFLSRFSQLLRQVIKHSKEENVKLSEELHALELFIKIELMRFEYTFDCHLDIDENIDLEAVLVPSSFLQAFVENAIWQARQNNQVKPEIHISLALSDPSIIICVQDNRNMYQNDDSRPADTHTDERVHEVITRLAFTHPDITIQRQRDEDKKYFYTKIFIPN